MSRTPFFVERNPYFLSGTTELNEKIYGFSSDLGDIDRYYLDAAPGKTYIISVSGVEADTFDPKLVIRNRAGEIVATNSGGLGSYDPVIHFKTDHGGGYTIDVVNEDDIPGSFSFLFSIQEGNYTDPYTRSYEPLVDPITGLQDLETKASFDSATRDSVVTKKELQDLLSSAGDGGVVSAQELYDLRIVAGNLSRYLAPDTTTYYQQIFDNVVLGSVANEYYTGGALKPEQLGDLHAGSSSAQLDKLIGKWFLGSDLPSPFMSADAAAGKDDKTGVYIEAPGPLFDSPIEFTDINQGVLGDCWFLSATASIAAFDPEVISDLFHDNQDGTYGVRFQAIDEKWQSKSTQEHWVTVNHHLPVNRDNPTTLEGVGSTPQKLITDELWPALLEKAAAQASELGIFRSIRGSNNDKNSYSSLSDGASEGLLMLQPSSLVTASASDALRQQYPGLITGLTTTPASWANYISSYKAAVEAGNGPAVIGSSYTTDETLEPLTLPSSAKSIGFINGHMYAATDLNHNQSMLTVYNPWGPSGASGFGPYVSPFAFNIYGLYDKLLAKSSSLISFSIK